MTWTAVKQRLAATRLRAWLCFRDDDAAARTMSDTPMKCSFCDAARDRGG
jgi:hypothetical protein